MLELPKLPEESDGTRLWTWLKLLKEQRVEDMEAIAEGNKAMKDVVVTFREMSEDEAERRNAEEAEKRARDRRAEIAYGEMVGEAKGEEERKKLAGQLEKAVQLLQEKGLSPEEIKNQIGAA